MNYTSKGNQFFKRIDGSLGFENSYCFNQYIIVLIFTNELTEIFYIDSDVERS